MAALDMGYGHLRAASAIASACGTEVALVDRPPLATANEQAKWLRARAWYERLSRAASHSYFPGANRLLDLVTSIAPLDSAKDLARPTAAAKYLERLIAEGMGASLAAHLKASREPLVATFYAPAIAADAHGAERVHLVVTDSDVNRVWVPCDPRRSRITYLAPTQTAVQRLTSYGVAPERVRLTGFPLPPELVGEDDVAARRALGARIVRLDRRGVFRAARGAELASTFGRLDAPPGPVSLVYAVGGAGAQANLGRVLLSALREPLARGEMRLVLVAGMRPRVAADFERWVAAARLPDTVSILYETSFAAYHRRFNETLAAADLLWTKPSELTFFGALGIPLLLAPPLGVHERRNRALAISLGAALDASDARRTASRLASLLDDGTLAAAAWSGFTSMTREGTRKILDVVAHA